MGRRQTNVVEKVQAGYFGSRVGTAEEDNTPGTTICHLGQSKLSCTHTYNKESIVSRTVLSRLPLAGADMSTPAPIVATTQKMDRLLDQMEEIIARQ